MFTHPLAHEMDEWCTAHLGNPSDPEYQGYLRLFAEGLLEKQQEQMSEHDNKGRFGMSKAAGCTRAPALSLMGYEGDGFSGSTRVTFEIGHNLEVMALALLKAMGKQVTGVQQPVEIEPFMLSYSDGILTSDDGSQSILSVKSNGYKFSAFRQGRWIRQGFTCLPFEGVRTAQPGWWAQAQAEMHGSGIQRAMFVVIAKDIVAAFKDDPYMQQSGSLTFYCEEVAYDPVFCALDLVPVWQEMWDAVQNDTQPQAYVWNTLDAKYSRLTKLADTSAGWGGVNRLVTGTFNPCFGCNMVTACRKEIAVRYRS